MELQENLANIHKQQIGLAAISYDSPAVLRDFAQRRNITFPLLSDPDSAMIRAYGILNDKMQANSPFFGVPHPGTFFIDPKGVVVTKYFEEDYRERYTASEILTRQLDLKAGTPHATIETPQLRLSTSGSLSTIRWGQRITLTLDIALKPGANKSKMHVYAPGVQGYIPIDWTIAESPAIKIHPAEYPASKKMRLKAIKETVPVYVDQFRILRDVTIGSDAKVKPLLSEKNELVITGTFRYQACDDRVCYPPQNIPVSWTLRFEELDRQRVPTELQRKAQPAVRPDY